MLLIQYNRFVGSQILLIGDDDLTSLAITIMSKKIFKNGTTGISQITVMDIDERILEYIQTNSHITKCIRQDFRDAPLKEYNNLFDCAFLDPPYTDDGLCLFLSRAIQYVKPQANLFVSFGHGTDKMQYRIQKMVVDSKLYITEIIPKFNSYIGAKSWGGVSDMIVLCATHDKKPLISGRYIGTSLYTHSIKNMPLNSYGEFLKGV